MELPKLRYIFQPSTIANTFKRKFKTQLIEYFNKNNFHNIYIYQYIYGQPHSTDTILLRMLDYNIDNIDVGMPTTYH